VQLYLILIAARVLEYLASQFKEMHELPFSMHIRIALQEESESDISAQ